MPISLPPKGDQAKKLGSYFAPLKVEAQAAPNMTVKVAEGSFWTADNTHMEYIGGNSPGISAPATNAKWVLITVKTTGMLGVINGAESGNPVLPDPSQYKDELPLAAIFVGDTTTAITNDMVYDLRPMWSIPPDSVSQAQLADFATITYVDNGLATKASVAGTTSPDFTLNLGGSNINQSSIIVERFGGSTAAIRFNETAPVGSPPVGTPAWEFTNDGTTWNPIGVASGSYYTQTDLDGGVLDVRYFTQNDLTATGVLDTRYYEISMADAKFTPFGHQHVATDIVGLANPVETINALGPVLGDVQLGLNELNDVTNASPIPGHVIVYRTTSGYVNGHLTTNDLLDVNTISNPPVVGDVLVNNGGGFVNRQLVKGDISDFTGSEFLLTTNLAGDPPVGDGPPDSNGVAQDVYGVKTFKDGVNIETSLTVTGTNTSIQTTELKVSDRYVDINWGETGVGVGGGTGVAGLRVDRGTPVGSPIANAAAILQWDEGTKQWEIGVEGNARKILTGGHTHVAAEILDFHATLEADLTNHNINLLQDVEYLSGPATGDYLRYSLTNKWQNQVFSTDVTTEINANNLEELQDVSYVGVAAGEFLQWTGAQWNNHAVVKSDISDFVETDYIHTTGNEVKTGDFTLNGNFLVQGGAGTTTFIESEHVHFNDDVVTLNAAETLSGVDGGTGSAGIEVERGLLTNVMLYWHEPALTWLGTHTIVTGSPPNPTLTISAVSFEGHQHVTSDITDLVVNSSDINELVGISGPVQPQLDDKISRAGDNMDNGANLTFGVAGEVLGLPAIPSATAATSKEYVDSLSATVTADKISRTGDSMDASANLNFSFNGEVLGLPATPSATAATSKEYVDAHIADTALHMTTAQNTYLDGITVTFAETNQLASISGNVQTLLDLKADKLTPAVDQNLASLDLATGNIVDSGVVVNDTLNTINEIWTANKIDTTKADKLTPAVNQNLAALDITTGNIVDSGVVVNDTLNTVNEIWTADKIDTTKADKVTGAVLGNIATLDASGNIVDSGNSAATFAIAAHQHVTADIIDWTTAFNAELGNNSASDLGDFTNNTANTGDFLRWSGTTWDNVAHTAISEFVRATGGVNEVVDGNKTFSGTTTFQSGVSMQGDFAVSGNANILGNLTVQGNQITLGDEIVTSNRITINSGGDTISAHGGGLVLDRDTGSPITENPAVILWDEIGGQRWMVGIYDVNVGTSTIENLAVENITVAQPDYELVVGSGIAAYTYGFTVPTPGAGKTGIQVFVNGIKQIEGAGKAFTIDYTTNTVTFIAGSEPAAGADVEFYGFGFIG